MGFLAWLIIVYAILTALAVVAFVKKKKAFGIVLLAIMGMGIVILGYLWITSPM